MKIIVLLVMGTQLAGCCGPLRQAIRAYGVAEEDHAAAVAELVKRCRGEPPAAGDVKACDAAIKSLDALKASAAQLKSVE